MASYSKKRAFRNEQEEAEVEQMLRAMMNDDRYDTKPSYSADTEAHPDNLISFVDKHMKYLSARPNLDPFHYVSNLKLMTRIR